MPLLWTGTLITVIRDLYSPGERGFRSSGVAPEQLRRSDYRDSNAFEIESKGCIFELYCVCFDEYPNNILDPTRLNIQHNYFQISRYKAL